MDPNRWAQIEEAFHAASDLRDAERSAYLDRVCQGDQSLRAEIEALLASLDDPNDFLRQVVTKEAGDILHASAEGQTIGAYRIIRQLGRGGMGAVYLAVRADDQYQKQVAIKLIRSGYEERSGVVRRFLNERQILASLEHPNIARLLDGGVTEAGLPYLVMEYVDGQTIDAFANERSLAAQERLRLFLDICGAVEYAHRSAIIHRDLKPSNILVNSEGVVKLLDFGIAKIARQDLDSLGQMTMTGPAERMLTPDYASPELIRGERISTAVDVYALGVILYELLTLRRPFRLTTSNLFEVERMVMKTDPPRPSAVTEGLVHKLDRGRQLDLDAIVRKAMRPDREERYRSVEALAADIARYLQGFPVEAREGTAMYRAGKFVRRHWLGVSAAVLFLVTVTALGAGMSVFAARAARERDAARSERSRAELVSSFLTSLFSGADPRSAQGTTLTARDLLDRGAKRIAGLDQQPEVKSRLLATMAEAYQHLGLFEQSEKLFTDQLQLEQRTSEPSSPRTLAVLRQLAEIQRLRGNYAMARTNLQAALQGLRSAPAPDHREIAHAANNLGLVEQELGNLKEATELFQEAVRLAANDPSFERESLTMRSNLAGALLDSADYDLAEVELRRVLARRTELLGRNHPQRTRSLLRLSLCLNQQGNYVEAEKLTLEALELSKKLWGPHHRDTRLARIRQALFRWRMFADPQSAVEIASVTRESAGDVGPRHPDTLLWRMLTVAVTPSPTTADAADCKTALGQLEESQGAQSPDLSRALEHCTEVSLRRGNFPEALRLAERGLAAHRRMVRVADHPQTAVTLVLLGRAQQGLGQRPEAERSLREAVRIDRRVFHRPHLQLADHLAALGSLLDSEEGRQLASEGQAMRRSIVSSVQSWQVKEQN